METMLYVLQVLAAVCFGVLSVFCLAGSCGILGIIFAVVDKVDSWRLSRFYKIAPMLCLYCQKKKLAYPGALYCGGACSARAEVASYRDKPAARVCRDVEL